MKNNILTLFPVLATIISTPMLTGFVLLGTHTSKLPATPDNPTIEFQYYSGTDVPSLTKKEDLLDGSYASLDDAALMKIILDTAIAQWNGVRGSYLKFAIKAVDGDLQRNPEDKVNDIVIEKNTDKSTAAFASPRTDPNDPLVINDCDISISNTSTSAAGLLKTITHELGHCVGLGHPHTNYGALMGYSRDGNDWRLGADDKAGIIFLYPDPNYANAHPRELIGCGHISGNRSTSPSLLFFLLILPLILALAKSAKRVRPQ